MSPSKSMMQFIALFLWGVGVTCGLVYAWRYEVSPAESNSACSHWPGGNSFALASDRPTLVMFVHPRCPCSRASLEELAVLMTRCRDRLDAQVLFFKPPTVASDWAQTDLWDSAARIPGVTVQVDAEGEEQQRFGACVSGEVFVFQPSGELLFHGGITASRGHGGDNAGRSALESFLIRDEVVDRTTPVFGCTLESPEPSAAHSITVEEN